MWISAPAGLWIYRCVVRESDSGYSLEEAALPLPDGVTLVEDLTRHGESCDMARQIAKSREGRTSRRLRKKVEMLFAHLKRILKLDRLRLRGPNGARDEFLLAAAAQNLRKLAKLIPMPDIQPA
jgi:hypothetical protein